MDRKSNSSLDTLKLLEEEPKKKGKHHCHKRKNEHEEFTSKKTFKQHGNICTENNISQEIQVQEQHFKCVINLKTTICPLKNKLEFFNWKESKPNSGVEEKPNIIISTEETKPKSFPNTDSKIRESITIKCFRKSCTSNRMINKGIKRNESANKIDRSKQLLSPISKAQSGYLTYDEISAESLSLYDNKPIKKKRLHKKHCKHCRHCKSYRKKGESKLDTLIKRAKERERDRVAKSRGVPLKDRLLQKSKEYTTSNDKPLYELPQYEDTHMQKEFSTKTDDEFTMYSSEMDISFVSRSTLVLDKGNLPYSPTDCLDIQENLSHNNHSYNTQNLKREMDIDAYSPIQSPDHCIKSDCVQIKTEPRNEVASLNNNNENAFKGFYVENVKVKTEVKLE